MLSLRSGRILSKASKGWSNAPGNHFFCIEEPFNTNRDLGNSADRISVDGIRKEFQRAAQVLSDTACLASACAPYYIEGGRFDPAYSQELAESELKAHKKRLARLPLAKTDPPAPKGASGSSPSRKDQEAPPKPGAGSSQHPGPRGPKPKFRSHQLSDLMPPHKPSPRHCTIDKRGS